MGRAILILLLWLVQACVVVALFSGEWIEGEMRSERALVQGQMGEAAELQLAVEAQARYQRWFVRPGAVAVGYERLLPDPSVPKRGMEGLAPWWFEWLEKRLDAFWWLIFQLVYRLHLLLHWVPIIALFVAGSMVEGFTRRAVKRSTFAYASADRHVLAKRSLVILGVFVLVYLLLPWKVNPLIVPLWGAALAATTALLIANTQHHV